MLVGADGVGSTVRAEMEKQLPGMSGQSCLLEHTPYGAAAVPGNLELALIYCKPVNA